MDDALKRRYAEEYIKDLHRTNAYRRARGRALSYNGDSAAASRLHNEPEVQDYIQQLQEERSARVKVDADYLLSELVAMQQADPADILDEDGNVRPLAEWPVEWRRMLNGFEVSELWDGGGKDREQIGLLKKLKWVDRNKLLELIGKHINVMAYRERSEISGPGGKPIEFTDTERAARIASIVDAARQRKQSEATAGDSTPPPEDGTDLV